MGVDVSVYVGPYLRVLVPVTTNTVVVATECSRCNRTFVPDVKFCPGCGQPVKAVTRSEDCAKCIGFSLPLGYGEANRFNEEPFRCQQDGKRCEEYILVPFHRSNLFIDPVTDGEVLSITAESVRQEVAETEQLLGEHLRQLRADYGADSAQVLFGAVPVYR